jgi:hypothetical protein
MKQNNTPLTLDEFLKPLWKRLRALRSGKPREPKDYDLIELEIRRHLEDLKRDEANVAKTRQYISELLGFIDFKKREIRLAELLAKMGFKPTMKGAE